MYVSGQRDKISSVQSTNLMKSAKNQEFIGDEESGNDVYIFFSMSSLPTFLSPCKFLMWAGGNGARVVELEQEWTKSVMCKNTIGIKGLIDRNLILA